MKISFTLACDPRTCVDNDNHDCGHCLKQTNCNNVDGTCNNGCEAGYHGRYCNISK